MILKRWRRFLSKNIWPKVLCFKTCLQACFNKETSSSPNREEPSKPTAAELLKEHEDDLLHICRRFHFLKEFDSQLRKLTGARLFEIRNDIVWQMAHDMMSMLIIDLTSLCNGMIGRGGFFNQLNNHLSELKFNKNWKKKMPPLNGDDEIDLYHAERIGKNTEEAFYRLFPGAKERGNTKINQTDTQALKTKLGKLAEVEKLDRDRNRNRAHRYEERRNQGGCDPVTLSEIERVISNLQELFTDIRLICDSSSMGYPSLNFANEESTSKDIIDIVLMGSLKMRDEFFGINRILYSTAHEFGWSLREKYYPKLFERHAELAKTKGKNPQEVPINAPAIIDGSDK